MNPFARLMPIDYGRHFNDVTPEWARAVANVGTALLRPFGGAVSLRYSRDGPGREPWAFVGLKLARWWSAPMEIVNR